MLLSWAAFFRLMGFVLHFKEQNILQNSFLAAGPLETASQKNFPAALRSYTLSPLVFHVFCGLPPAPANPLL